MKKFAVLAAAVAISVAASAGKPKIDYSLVSVPEEGGVKFERITEDADAVSSVFPAKKSLFKFGGGKGSTVDWWVNPQIAVTPDGKKLAYINNKNGTTNVMVKDAKRGGSSVQRTFRTNVRDFTLSPDGSTICFTEWRSGHYGIYLVDAVQGNVVRQVSNGTDNDFAGQITKDNNNIYFHRGEGFGAYSLWSWDRKNNLFSNYSRGMSPVIDHQQRDVIYCARFTDKQESEIWRLNLKTGVEELILGLPGRSFTTPNLALTAGGYSSPAHPAPKNSRTSTLTSSPSAPMAPSSPSSPSTPATTFQPSGPLTERASTSCLSEAPLRKVSTMCGRWISTFESTTRISNPALSHTYTVNQHNQSL